ncbi:HD domain-containing protein [Treponema primitia]|uniref:HD-GYP domain-containing protein n=1 Tax=Treponema primitia TaxID=88058 RepID=UPI0039810D08
MNIRMDTLIEAIAVALDIVEGELLGASTHHGKRIAALCSAMGRYLGLSEDDLSSLTSCALLHDNALTEYILSEREGWEQDSSMKLHCQFGQRNADTLRFKTNIDGFILYHHERANGDGPYGKKTGEYPLGAELIGIADFIDVSHHLQTVGPDRLPQLRRDITDNIGVIHTPLAAEAMLAALDEAMLLSLGDNRILDTANRLIPPWTMDMDSQVILNLAGFVSHIIDYKSAFTRRHSAGIADRSWIMGQYYGYDHTLLSELYLAASLHDIGKLAIPTQILEKPDKLDNDEFNIIKGHALKTYELLGDIDGFEQIRNWASNHHEKLDGSGYPFGKKANELDFNSRLMACIDIYQAVSEARPYHPERDHKTTMEILYDMAGKGYVDEKIAKDMDKALSVLT